MRERGELAHHLVNILSMTELNKCNAETKNNKKYNRKTKSVRGTNEVKVKKGKFKRKSNVERTFSFNCE